MQNLVIDAERLWDTIHETAAFGACGGGIARLALSEDDRRARDWFRAAAEVAGCHVSVDAVGNMFARRAGRRADLAPIAIGSHLDTQPTGGRFDGVLGVLAGLEILRTLEAAGYVTTAPLEIINWTNEEGSRFAPAALGSAAFAGAGAPRMALDRVDRDGVRLEEALAAIGYDGPVPCGDHRLAAYLELHIEQGPILEAEGVAIGAVAGIQAARWLDVTLTGRSGHTGATPMQGRRNALVGAARVVTMVDELGHAPEAVATVGSLQPSPNSRNVIPGEVALSADLRHPDDAALAAMARAFEDRLASLAAELGLAHQVHTTLDSPAIRFAPQVIACIEAGADRAGLTHRRMISGAMHDAGHLGTVAPSAMIFVPCLDGVSHTFEESASRADCAAGAQVLLNAMLALDATFA